MNKRIRQYIGLLSAILTYYIIHEGSHLLYALLTQDDSLILKLLEKMNIQKEFFINRVEQALNKRPKVQGGQIYMSQDLNQVLIHAEDEAKRMGDEYVSVEHLFLALMHYQSKTMKKLFWAVVVIALAVGAYYYFTNDSKPAEAKTEEAKTEEKVETPAETPAEGEEVAPVEGEEAPVEGEQAPVEGEQAPETPKAE